jgi:acetolactate synthase-1/2/3 large subunit
MNTSEILVKILEDANVKFIFGHPGEQILPFYSALSKSNIKHVLFRNEQGAAMAAEGYARSSGDFGLCVATAGPGALNMVMAVAVAFKDSVPILVITGDVPVNLKGYETFQDVELVSIFESITIKSFNPSNGELSIKNLKEALEILKTEPRGPIHLNLPKDILLDENIKAPIKKDFVYNPNYDYSNLKIAIDKLKMAKRPLVIAGAGIRWSKSLNEFKNFITKNNILTTTTYHGKGIIDENDPLNLGMVGIRGTKSANYAFKNSDLILVLGGKLSERTMNIDALPLTSLSEIFETYKSKIIHVNINKNSLKGNINIHGDVKKVLNHLNKENDLSINFDENWIEEVNKNSENIEDMDIEDMDFKTIKSPLKPQIAISKILNSYQDSYVVNDAGSHTTWTMLFSKPIGDGQLIYSGAMAPMGYGLPGAVGVGIANPKNNIAVIIGDGGIQMNIQELATIAEYNLPIAIFLINNSQLGIIRQWEELFYNMDHYEVDLQNPDFITIAKGYSIEAKRVNTLDELDTAINLAKTSKKPFLFDIIVDEEDIPLPNSFQNNK